MTLDEALCAVPPENREAFLVAVRELEARASRTRASETERAIALRVLFVLGGGAPR